MKHRKLISSSKFILSNSKWAHQVQHKYATINTIHHTFFAADRGMAFNSERICFWSLNWLKVFSSHRAISLEYGAWSMTFVAFFDQKFLHNSKKMLRFSGTCRLGSSSIPKILVITLWTEFKDIPISCATM